MNSWGESEIGLVYLTGLLIALAVGLASVMYLMPTRSVMEKIFRQHGTWWSRTTVTSLIVAALLGAMSISFTDCHGGYDRLIGNPRDTVVLGLNQVSAAMVSLAIVAGFWFLILTVGRLFALGQMKGQIFLKVVLLVLLLAVVLLWTVLLDYGIDS